MGYIEELRALVGHRRLILAGASCVICNDRGELLLQQRVYPAGRWCFPGGLMELGESVQETARREVLEETGITVGALRLIGVYSGPDHLCRAAEMVWSGVVCGEHVVFRRGLDGRAARERRGVRASRLGAPGGHARNAGALAPGDSAGLFENEDRLKEGAGFPAPSFFNL